MDEKKSKLTEWLENLQQESWQLELLISGFAIVLLGSAHEPVIDINHKLIFFFEGIQDKTYGQFLPMFGIILYLGWFFLLANLIFHVFMRGLWISTIGLRYVSGDIDYQELKLTHEFESFLKRRIKSFDNYIQNLEILCSIIFSFTFLILFCLLSFCLCAFFLLNSINFFLQKLGINYISGGIIILFFGLTSLMYFIDFITLGFFKRIKWLSKIYYPIYRFYSVITLAALYRPIYYNLIDNKFGKWLGALMVPYIIIGIFFLVPQSDPIKTHIYYVQDNQEKELKDSYYLEMVQDKHFYIQEPIIKTKFITNGYLELFIPYRPTEDDKTLRTICPDFVPPEMKSDGIVRFEGAVDSLKMLEEERQRIKSDSAFHCLRELYMAQLNDSTLQNIPFKLHEMSSDWYRVKGLQAILDVEPLGRGEHRIIIRKKQLSDESTLDTQQIASIPFWVE